jgi:O-antigen ligase
LATLVDRIEEELRKRLAVVEPYRRKILDLAERPLALDQYLIYSTVLSVFLIVFMMRKGVDIFLGYPIVVVNTVILLIQNRLVMHRHHAAVVVAAALISFIASASAATPGMAIIAQVLGIVLFSTYFFSMLTNFGLSLPRWVQIYTHFALAIVILGFVIYILRHLHLMPFGRETRLRSIYPEPSLFVYVTLPAFGIYANAYLRDRTHRLELWIFIIAYIFADSSLGFLGMLLVAFFAFLPRLSIAKMMGFGLLAVSALVGLFFVSTNFRLRVVDTFLGLTTMNFGAVNASSFAFLSNGYVAIQTFLTHPLIGVGLGGYQYAYLKYVPFLSADLNDPELITINMFDASSLFFRTAAEMGLIGLVALFGFLIICSRVRGDQHVDIRNAIMPYLLVRMSRYGAWFSLELYFFVGLFLLNYLHSRAQYGSKPPGPAAPRPHLI